MMRIRMVTVTVMVVVVVGFLTTSAAAKLHKVGDEQGWNPNVNYTQWSADKEFYVGEWLIFNFDKRYYTALEVNETSFDSCNDKVFITNITRGGRDVFELKEARPYYFLSSGGYCYHGMKLALVVQEQPPLAPAQAPALNASPNSLTSCAKISILSLIVVSFALMANFSW
ncbi:putative cupredoxin [Rosa chinensis]|uniref:Putative cupredoxin n=1 Tax=Rosa chinensis TaxID=74649 RepID=A0A2P6S463_ROSCH|nr:lamin-like protein [Rosa chinensis]PRQ53477.1 putative cupredoxin [Rosa chinensis]